MTRNVIPIETGRHAENEAMRVAEHARDEALLAADDVALSRARPSRPRSKSHDRPSGADSGRDSHAGQGVEATHPTPRRAIA